MADGEAAKATASSSPRSTTESIRGGTLDDESNSPFKCCVCLDLLYKPVVLACGHISCFWCVQKAMHGLRASHCPICRRPYNHFPSICQLLHFLLLKLEPVAYKRREMEVLEEEKQADIYSPRFADPSKLKLHFDSVSSDENLKSKGFGDLDQPENCLDSTAKRNISVDDVSCSLCKKILYHPAVLNCGHVYCETCLSDLGGEPLQCQVCQSLHPADLPNICLDLDHFLEEKFPREYAARREEVLLKKAECQPMNPLSNAVQTEKPEEEAMDSCSNEDLSDVHVDVGCDSCGMYPITGKRYKCKDCKEAVGFDLCEECYNTASKLPGRFNQQHTPDHRFVLDESHSLRNMLVEGAFELDILQEAADVPIPIGDDPQDHEDHDHKGSGDEHELR